MVICCQQGVCVLGGFPSASVLVFCVCVSEVTVKNSDLKLCKDDERVCVTDLRDCGPRPASSIQSEHTHTHTQQ